VNVAKQWARSLQSRNQQQFEGTVNARSLSPVSYSDELAATFAACGTEAPEMLAFVADGTRGRERYIVVGRYSGACIRQSNAPPTDTFVVYELTIDGAPRIDTWTFGKPPGM
jgi:hypothetical protein